MVLTLLFSFLGAFFGAFLGRKAFHKINHEVQRQAELNHQAKGIVPLEPPVGWIEDLPDDNPIKKKRIYNAEKNAIRNDQKEIKK